jgi:TorA maturation chaperone TorD
MRFHPMDERFLIIGDLYAGVAFGFDLPSINHVEIGEKNLLLVALARANKWDGYRSWFDNFYDVLLHYGNNEIGLSLLKREYQRLFEPPSPIAPPYESLYLGSLLGERMEDVLKFYKSEGIQPSPDYHELPDHITVELDFLSRLAYRVSGGNSQERMLKFIELHILNWVPQFLELVKENTKEKYYRELAIFTGELIFKTRKILWEKG